MVKVKVTRSKNVVLGDLIGVLLRIGELGEESASKFHAKSRNGCRYKHYKDFCAEGLYHPWLSEINAAVGYQEVAGHAYEWLLLIG